MRITITLILTAILFLYAERSYSGFSHTIELEGDVIHIILTADFWLGSGVCPEPIIYWIANDDSLHLNVLHLWEGATAYAFCTRTDTVSITRSPMFTLPCKLLIEQTWIWGSALQLHSMEEEDLCTVNVSEHIGTSQAGMYPNPATDHIWISGMLPGQRLEVFDVFGRSIQEMSVISEPQRIQTQGWSRGSYLVRITDRHGIVGTRRLILE